MKRPCWVISYASLTKEESAVKEVQRLKTKGYKAGYYYIPDYKPGGHTLYKIYIGPFNTANEPNSIIAAIKQLSKDAYILKVE